MQKEIFVGNLNGFDYYVYPYMDEENGKFETTFSHARDIVASENKFSPFDVCLPPAELIDIVLMELDLPKGEYWLNSSMRYYDKTVHGFAFDSGENVLTFPEKAKVVFLHRVPEKE